MKSFSRNTKPLAARSLIICILLVMLVLPSMVHAQEAHVEFYRESLKINNIGMAVLGTWALANISLGAWGWSHQTGQQAYFHQMNMFWNTVNLTIAGIALYGNLTAEYDLLSGGELLGKQLRTERIYLINGALDLGYVATGFLLRHLAPRYPKSELRLRGYGNSVILQGSFLLVFDAVMYGLQHSHRVEFLNHIALSPMHNAWGMVLSVQF